MAAGSLERIGQKPCNQCGHRASVHTTHCTYCDCDFTYEEALLPDWTPDDMAPETRNHFLRGAFARAQNRCECRWNDCDARIHGNGAKKPGSSQLRCTRKLSLTEDEYWEFLRGHILCSPCFHYRSAVENVGIFDCGYTAFEGWVVEDLLK